MVGVPLPKHGFERVSIGHAESVRYGSCGTKHDERNPDREGGDIK
jgi:hypothetical protein